jgi:hypothetical protein
MDERSGCAIVMGQSEVKIRLVEQMSILKAQVIIKAIKITRR